MNSFLSHIKAAKGNQKGMTLIDVSITIIVIALIAYPMVKEYDRYVKGQRYAEIQDSFYSIHSAIELFYFANNRYPCPANPELDSDETNYGVEMRNAGTGFCTDIAGTDLAAADDIVEGMVPFKALGLEETKAYDSWDNRYSYAVSATMASTLFLQTDYASGVPTSSPYITINGTGAEDGSVTITDISGHYFLLSLGQTAAGAYNREGDVPVACPPDTVLESENCDRDGVFFSRSGYNIDFTKEISVVSEVNDVSFFDDYTSFRVRDAAGPPPERVGLPDENMDWTPENAVTGNIENQIFTVGIGTQTPDDTVEVVGDIYVGSGNALGPQICNDFSYDGAGNPVDDFCFPPLTIAGSTTDADGDTVGFIWCEDGNGFASAIQANDAVCDPTSVDYFAGVRGDCGSAGIKGILGGAVVCGP